MKTQIEIGDKVNVYWEHAECEFECTVVWKPGDTDDRCWVLRRANGSIINVQHFGKMELYVVPVPKPEIDLSVF